MKNLKNNSVLVLGWEFPPRMVGGLAIATAGLVTALSQFLQVHLILPYADEQSPKIPNVTIYGLNQMTDILTEKQLEMLAKNSLYFSEKKEVFSYPFYESDGHELSINSTTLPAQTEIKKTKQIRNRLTNYLEIFKSEEIYGLSLWKKLSVFSTLATAIADTIDFDIIHCHDWLTFEAGKKLKTTFNKPLCLHVHALETDRIGKEVKNKIYDIEYSAMKMADVVMPVSHYTKTQIIKHYQILPEKINPIYNAIEPQLIERWRHRIPQKIVTFLGRITSQKGPSFLFETASKVIETYKNVRFIIAGTGDQLASLVDASAYQKMSKYFIFTGFLSRSEVNALLSTSDVYFMPSVSEPFGLTALEAARAGVPCVLTKQSGVAEILTSALTADFWDTNLFAQHIINLLKNERLRTTIAAKNHLEMNKITWDYSASVVAAEYLKIIEN